MERNHTEVGINSTLVPQTGATLYTDYWEYAMYICTIRYVSPVLITLGTVCNILSLVVLSTAAYRNSSSGFLLSVLAITDTGVLNTGLLRVWIKSIWKDTDLRLFGSGPCKLHIFFTYFFSHLSAWTLSVVTLERVICVCVPLKIRELCRLKRIASGWTLLCFVIILFNIPLFWSVDIVTKSNKTRCAAIPEYEYYINVVWQWLDIFLVSFGPFLVIFVGNVIIIGKMASMYHQRKQMTQTSAQRDKTTSTTLMLIAVSIAFLLTTSPSSVYFVGMAYQIWPTGTEKELAQLYGAYALCYLLYYLNSTINFFLYCASGSRFRQALIRLCFKGTSYKANTTNVSRLSESQTPRSTNGNDIALSNM